MELHNNLTRFKSVASEKHSIQPAWNLPLYATNIEDIEI